MTNKQVCQHIRDIKEMKEPDAYKCEECIKSGGCWVHLRTCQQCGVTLCCESSPRQHMLHPFMQTGHPVIISAEPGEQWLYCYKDEIIVDHDQ